MHFSPLKNGDAEAHSRIDGAVRGSRIHSGDSIVGYLFYRGISFRRTGFFLELGWLRRRKSRLQPPLPNRRPRSIQLALKLQF
jgi:hypothetical protein